jgi:hypothetical protein
MSRKRARFFDANGKTAQLNLPTEPRSPSMTLARLSLLTILPHRVSETVTASVMLFALDPDQFPQTFAVY